MLDSNNILKYLQLKGKNYSIDDINNLIATQDREKISATQKERYQYEIWDKKSAINGVDAKEIIESRKYDINQAYLIYIDGELVYFQDHNPKETGYKTMNKTEAKKQAETFINQKVEEAVDNIILNYVLNNIDK